MYTLEEIQEYIERLKQASRRATDADQFTRAVDLDNAAKILSEWLKQGMPGEMPVDVRTMLGEEKPALQEVIERAKRVEKERLRDPEEALADQAYPPKQELVDLLKEAQQESREENYQGAQRILQDIIQRTKSETLRREAEEELKRVEEAFRERLKEALDRAWSVEKEQPGNLVARREAWEKVRALDPRHPDALEAITRIEQEDKLHNLRKQISSLREPLRAMFKDLKDVEEARLKAHELLHGEPIPDPELARELAEVHEQLNALRDEILRTSEGGASNERAKNFEEAIRVYSEALKKGYKVIADDTTGEPIDVQEALKRTRLDYWKDLQGRARWRLKEADKALRERYPETAVERLKEAEELMKKVEEGGEELRLEIDQALSKAKEALRNWRKARRLVTEAEQMLSPQEALGKLYEARQVFPSYLNLNDTIAKKERLVADQAARDIATDLSSARGAMAARDFERAREHCQEALKRGAGLGVETDELRKRRQEAKALLNQIDVAEARWKRLEEIERALDEKNIDRAEQLILQLLDERPEEESSPEVRRYRRRLNQLKIDRALEAGDTRWAQRLLDQLSEEEKRAPWVAERRTRLALLQEDDRKYAEAEHLFLEEEDYEHTIELCKSLKDSPDFKKQALALCRRAEARLWLRQAREAYEKGDLKEARKRFQAVERLRSKLPDEDQPLVQEAETKRKQVEREQKQAEKLSRKLRRAKSLREKPGVRWGEWYGIIKALREGAPRWFQSKVEGEYEEGAKEWMERACEEARRLVGEGAIRRAYEVLKPLADVRLLPPDEPLWREVEYKHYLVEAQRLLASPQPEEWEEAEKMAQEARRVAPEAQLKEAQEAFWEIVCRAVSQRTDFLAATANPGPEGAVQFVEEKMQQYPVLRMEPQLRCRLIRYYLDLEDYPKALEQAQTMGYVPGEEKAAVFWEQLVKATQGFADGRWEQAVNTLVDVQRQAGEVSPRLKEVHDYVVQRVLTQLHQKVSSAPPAISDEELVTHIQALDLILRLDPENPTAREESKRLADRLVGLIRPLRRQAEIELGASLQRSLEEAERMLSRVQSVIRTWEVIGGSEDKIAPLRGAEKGLQEQVKPWREAWTALQQLEDQWSRSVSGTWDIQELEKRLEEAQRALRGSEVEEITSWEERIGDLKEGTTELEKLIGQAEQEWREENFEQFIDIVDKIQEKVSEVRNKLGEERFIVPEKKLNLYDIFAQARVAGIKALRERAQEKLDNLERWKAWKADAEQVANQRKISWKQIEDWTQAVPPCLSRPLRELGPLEQRLEKLREKVNARPEKVLSDKARSIAKQFTSERFLQRLSDMLNQVRQKRQQLEEQIKAVREPLSKIEEFARSKRPLSNRRNRQALRQLLEELKAVDSCHPKLEEYESLLKRFEK